MFVGMVTAGCRDSSVRVSLSGLGLLLYFFKKKFFFFLYGFQKKRETLLLTTTAITITVWLLSPRNEDRERTTHTREWGKRDRLKPRQQMNPVYRLQLM
jgi:hypothetical protein